MKAVRPMSPRSFCRPAAKIVVYVCLAPFVACSQQSALPAASEASAPATSEASRAAIGALVAKAKANLVFLPAGTFEMGDWGNEQGLPYDGEENSRPVHTVTLDGFSMMAYKVTYEEFDLFTDAVGERRVNQDVLDAKDRKPRKPAGVNWYGAKAYCGWLGKLAELPFDLPTEAQWEYAARSGGKKVLFATDNGNIDKERNFPWNPKDGTTPDVGSFPPNPSGLYGMADYYASEWVNDWYDPDYYKSSPRSNPMGPDAGKPRNAARSELGPTKVIRGHSSPGNSPAFGGFVFSRNGKTLRETLAEFASQFPGYSGWHSTQFRCAVKLAQPLR